MSVRVAIDGGQTGLRLRIVETNVTTEVAGFRWSSDPTTDVLAAIAAAWRQAAGDTPPDVSIVCGGFTGWPADRDEQRRFSSEVAGILGAREVRAAADVVCAHAGAFPHGDGVVLAAGTGVIALGVDQKTGRWERVDGWGHLLGDAGSAFAIGRAGLEAVMRATDRRGPATTLLTEATARYGDPHRLSRTIYTSPSVITDLAGFAVVVIEQAAVDDVARKIVQAAAEELTHTAATAARVFGDGDTAQLATTGRLIQPGNYLDVELDRQLSASGHRLKRVAPASGPLDGAARLASQEELSPYTALIHRWTRP